MTHRPELLNLTGLAWAILRPFLVLLTLLVYWITGSGMA